MVRLQIQARFGPIQEFLIPTNITELRSFMGLVNQLGDFTDQISFAALPLRDLMKHRSPFVWMPCHGGAFTAVKMALVSPPSLAQYDPSLPTVLHTDASRRKGLGFALLQQHGEQWRLVQCVSRFLKDSETCYAIVELELGGLSGPEMSSVSPRTIVLQRCDGSSTINPGT